MFVGKRNLLGVLVLDARDSERALVESTWWWRHEIGGHFEKLRAPPNVAPLARLLRSFPGVNPGVNPGVTDDFALIPQMLHCSKPFKCLFVFFIFFSFRVSTGFCYDRRWSALTRGFEAPRALGSRSDGGKNAADRAIPLRLYANVRKRALWVKATGRVRVPRKIR